jgi:hypothetical protein
VESFASGFAPQLDPKIMTKLNSFFAMAVAASAILLPSALGEPREIIVHHPNPHAGLAPTAGSNSKVNPGIVYHGGPVMGGLPNAYVIWYGAWTDTQKLIITDFLNGIGGSPYLAINQTYSLSAGQITGDVNYAGSWIYDGAAFALPLSDLNIEQIVAAALASGALGSPDPNGVYFVLTGSNITKSGFCTSYCGWHSYSTLSDTDIKYSFVGNPTACGGSIGACSPQVASPNGDRGVDAMVSVIAHELEEAITDPDLNAWWDNRGYENADKCAWTFGASQPVPGNTAAYYNTKITLLDNLNNPVRTRYYLVQRNLVRTFGKSGETDYCATKWDGTAYSQAPGESSANLP